jgi:hypothetical protein
MQVTKKLENISVMLLLLLKEVTHFDIHISMLPTTIATFGINR